MFEKLFKVFGRGAKAVQQQAPAGTAASGQGDPRLPALLHAIAEQQASDPLIAAKIGGLDVFQRVADAMQRERGVHAASMLCVLAALAGYACQASVRAQALAAGLAEDALLVRMTTTDGRIWFFGDELNQGVAEARYSVWTLAAAAAQDAGLLALPDPTEFFAHASRVLGTEQFGVPRVDPDHAPGDTPLNYLKATWPGVFPMARRLCPAPEHWPLMFGLAVQRAIAEAAPTFPPAPALQIVMDTAVAMSKVDLEHA